MVILVDTPYTPEQILNVVTHLIKTFGHYSIEFRKWILKPEVERTYVNL